MIGIPLMSNKISISLMTISSLVTCAIPFFMVAYFYRQYCASRKYFIVGRVKKLIIYPVKSLPGIEVPEVNLTQTCLQYNGIRDRSWVIVDSQGTFISQRRYPSLTLLKVGLTHNNKLQISKPNGDTLVVEKLAMSPDREVIWLRVWKDLVQGIVVSDRASEFFSSYLGEDMRLVQFPYDTDPESIRRFSQNVRYRPIRVHQQLVDTQNKILYQDASPCLIMNTTSIDDLNQRMTDSHVSYRNFRPSILITAPPYKEDCYSRMLINGVEIVRLERCGRCKLTTVNPDSGIFMDEPLKTLRLYRSPKGINERRKYGTSPVLGIHCRPTTTGKIHVKDDIWAQYSCIV